MSDEFDDDFYVKIPPNKTFMIQLEVVGISKGKMSTMDAEELELLMWDGDSDD